MPDLESIIESIVQGDQDAVQLQLDCYNIQYAECFFFNTEEEERKKQKELEEFRKNKVREYRPDSNSDLDSDDNEPDLFLRQRLTEALLSFINNQLQPPVLRTCLHTLRILSRDRRALGPLVTDNALLTFANLGGISISQTYPQQEEERNEDDLETSNGPVCGIIGEEDVLTSVTVSSRSSAEDPGAASGNICLQQSYNWREDGGHVVLHRGKKDIREEKSDEEEKEEDGEVCRKEAIKVLCNVIYNSSMAQERASALRLLHGLWKNLKQGIRGPGSSSDRFYKLRLLFLLTALRPELRVQLQKEHGVSVLTKVLEQCLGVRSADNCYRNLPISKDMSQQVIEILKILFNVVHRFHRQDLDEEEAALCRQLAAVLRYCLMLTSDEDTLEELQGHTVNVLSALPLACLDILLAVPVNQASHECDGVNMDCVHALVLFMERRLNRSSMLKEKLTPVLNLLTESSRVHRETRHYLRQKILPPLRDVDVRPEHDTALRGQLVRLMTHVDTDVKYCAAELLFVLCKENVSRFVKYTGYGNAAGLLAARGLLNGRWNSTEYSTQYSSDSDSDTEEYKEARNRINLVTGRVEEEQPDPMEGLTDEEKEAEALRLIGMINRLSQDQIIQPMGVTIQGRMAPLFNPNMGYMFEDEEESEEEENMDVIIDGRKHKQME
ncbi:synembryn-A [Sphaeramia orbicularis]|uniref:synembryn-A n=1 Tax=Sphaeramia orbicularis TaxID=375764 RepID=UPI00118014AF|nr:synembryn-A-like [Sphaeramia orbicularis]XP_029997852.1 synembryn-A-like [Sphaeramia orbicularis]